MTENVVLTKEQAEAFKAIREQIFDTELGKLTAKDIAKCVVGMYEVEKSPEERLREWYESAEDLYENLGEDYDGGVVFGIQHTLYTLGIKIEGINA